MSSKTWWLPAVAPLLEQGDLIHTSVIFQPVTPVKYLTRSGTSKKLRQLWEESPEIPESADENTRIVGTVTTGLALVLSYGCEIDKPRKPVLLAPVYALESLNGDLALVLAQSVPRYLPLVDLPGGGAGYASLGRTFSIQQSTITSSDRLKSMTPEGILRVQAQLIGFYTRLPLL